MKCKVSSSSSHGVLISKEISYKSYREICSGEKKKVNLGHWGNWWDFKVENNSMVPMSRNLEYNIHGASSILTKDCEVLSKFFSIHNIEPNWLHCNFDAGNYNESLEEWTGCIGQVCGTE